MRTKYIEELVGRYYLWPEGKETSDIATSRTHDDIAGGVDTDYAKVLCEDRNKLVEALIYAVNAHKENDNKIFSEIREKFYNKDEI